MKRPCFISWLMLPAVYKYVKEIRSVNKKKRLIKCNTMTDFAGHPEPFLSSGKQTVV